MTMKTIAIVIAITIGLVGCTSLPGQGPRAADLVSSTFDEDVSPDFLAIDLDMAVVASIGDVPSVGFGKNLGSAAGAPQEQRIGLGDELLVRIWENSAEGLFSTSDSKSTEIPVAVNEDGNIYIPYVGSLQVSGVRVSVVRSRIAAALVGKAVDPDVTVLLSDNGTQTISVVGDANSPGVVPIPPSGMRLLDAVAAAGGSREPSFETQVSVIRGGSIASMRLDDILRDASNNIWLSSRDTIQLLHRPRSFTAFGAVTDSKEQLFESDTVTLAEALAQTGGLDDNLADDGGVFVFRFETAARVVEAGAEVPSRADPRRVPTIYRLDFTTPQAFFLAQSFMMQDDDIIYVANAAASEFQKFVNVILSPLIVVGNSAQ
jgi:polysaccharide export outer membrane protein